MRRTEPADKPPQRRGGALGPRAPLLLAILTALSLLALTCKKEPPPAVHIPTLALAAVDASCTEAWLKLTTTQLPATVRLVRLTPTLQTLQTLQLTTPDTLLIDEGLLPNRTYTYKAYRLEPQTPNPTDSTQPVQLTTMDSTSHNFTWQIDTLGDGSSSVLYDVAIINDTLAYAVGEIYKRDSLGNWDPQPYGLAIWNGRSWSLRKIMVVSQQGDVHSRVLRGVYAFSATDVWFGDGNAFHWDGQSTFATAYWISGYPGNPTPVLGPNQGVHKFWGTSSSNLYGVGVNGGIAHYDGVRWRRIESGTNADLRDVYGNVRSQNVWAVGYLTDFSNSSLLEYNGQMWRTVRRQSNASPRYADSLSGIMTSVWAFSERHIDVASSAGMYRIQGGSRGEAKRTWLPAPFSVGLFNRVRGDERNNVFVVAPFGTVAHYNGVSWKQYQEFFNLSGHPNLLGLSVNESRVMAVGYSGVRAIVIRGRKQ